MKSLATMLRTSVILLSAIPALAEIPVAPSLTEAPLAPNLTFTDETQSVLDGPQHFVDDHPAINENGTVNAVVEIPAGTNAKWEVKPDGKLHWDMKNGKVRTVNYLPYPGNYGCISGTLQEDGDPLDIIVLAPAYPRGTVVPVHLVGVIRLIDDGEEDSKMLAVADGTPLGEIRTTEELNEKYPGVQTIIQAFFAYYKGPDGGGMVFKGFGDEKEANENVKKAVEVYEASKSTR